MFKTWIQAARPKTLTASVVPIFGVSALAVRASVFQWGIFASTLVGALCIQIGTNFVNDASDFLKGADDENRLGPTRMAAAGLLSTRALFRGAALVFLLAILAGMYLTSIGGWPIFSLGLVSIFFAIAYTAGPFPLAYLGLGDLFVLLFFGFAAVLGTQYLYFGTINSQGLWLSLLVGIHATALIAINNTRDIPTDQRAGKRTLSLRMGDRLSRYYYCLLIFAPFPLWFALALKSGYLQMNSLFLYLPMMALPLAIQNSHHCLVIVNRKEFNFLLAKTGALQLVFGVLISLALLLG